MEWATAHFQLWVVTLSGVAIGKARLRVGPRARHRRWAHDLILLCPRLRHQFEVATWLEWDKVAGVTTGRAWCAQARHAHESGGTRVQQR